MTGTDTQGWAKRLLGDVWVPAQLWIVNKESGNTYTIENTNSRTYLDLGMLFPAHALMNSYSQNCTAKPDDGTPVEGFAPSGKPEQKWVITQVPGHPYYVYVQPFRLLFPKLILTDLNAAAFETLEPEVCLFFFSLAEQH